MKPFQRYFEVILKNESDVGHLYAAPEIPYFNELTRKRFDSWEPIAVTLRGGRAADLMDCPKGFNICTTRLRDAIQQALGPKDEVQWLEFHATFPDGRQETCWAISLYKSFDVLDHEKTLWLKDYPRRPVFDSRKAEGHHLFQYMPGDPFFAVSGDMKRVMDRFDCAAYGFTQREVV